MIGAPFARCAMFDVALAIDVTIRPLASLHQACDFAQASGSSSSSLACGWIAADSDPSGGCQAYTASIQAVQRHIADFFALLGGGISEPGWQNTKFTRARLAIIPGYSHYNLGTAPELGPVIDKFLADPLTGSTSDAAAASSAGPMQNQ